MDAWAKLIATAPGMAQRKMDCGIPAMVMGQGVRRSCAMAVVMATFNWQKLAPQAAAGPSSPLAPPLQHKVALLLRTTLINEQGKHPVLDEGCMEI